jgi:hypothetical protein
MAVDEARQTLQTDEVARNVLNQPLMARLAYTWSDGTPRVVPMWFHWTGQDIIMGAPPNSPKMKSLNERPQVAISIDTVEWPYQWLTIRGPASVEIVSDPLPFPEYESMAYRYLGKDGGDFFLNAHRQTFTDWARITIRPEQVRVLDFQGRFPGAWSPKDGA